MKQMTLILLFISLFSILKAPDYKVCYVPAPEVIAPYEKLWRAVCMVESSGDPFAIGDRHLKNKSYGIIQIRAVRLDDYFNRTGIRYEVTEMFDTVKSKEVFMYYASGDYETVARLWNGGDLGMSKKSTVKYWNKVKELL